jgi:hypothetical protein
VGSRGEELARQVKAIVKPSKALRRRQSEKRTRKRAEVRESGHGSPGRESSGGALQDESGPAFFASNRGEG